MTDKVDKSSAENSESYGSTSFTTDSKSIANYGGGRDGNPVQTTTKNGVSSVGNSDTNNSNPNQAGGQHDSKTKEINGTNLTNRLSGGGGAPPNEKPDALSFPMRYTTRDGAAQGNVVVDESETLQLVDRGHERELTNTEAILHLFKIFTGPSTIGMPAVIKNGGILFGSLGFIVFGYLTVYGNILIVNCGQILCRRTKISSLRYEELMELIVLSYSESRRARALAVGVRRLTTIMLCLCQFGILAFYIQVIGTIVQSVLETSEVEYNLPLFVTKIFIALALVPYSWMRNLKILSWFSMIANFSIFICIVTILQYACRNLRPASELPLITENLWTIPLFVSASVFTVEGVPMLLPIENRVKNPEAYGGLCGIITLAATGNIIINMTLGFYGYLSFGGSVPSNVLTAMPNHPWYYVISLLYGLMVFLTFTLQLFLPAEFVVDALLKRSRSDMFQSYVDIVVRTMLVLASYIMTTIVSDIELIMSLTGAFCSVPLLFLFPSVGELLVLKKEPGGIPKHVWVRNVLIFVFGLITFVAGTFIAVVRIVERF